MPLYVFAGQDMLACVLRASDRDPASVGSALIKRRLVPLRRAWPKTKIIVLADSGFCRPRVLRRLERWGVSYIIGLQKNSRLAQQVELAELALADQYPPSRPSGACSVVFSVWSATSPKRLSCLPSVKLNSIA